MDKLCTFIAFSEDLIREVCGDYLWGLGCPPIQRFYYDIMLSYRQYHCIVVFSICEAIDDSRRL